MYVCVCNALTDRDFRHAARHGARTVREAFQGLGETPQCGRCFSCARQVLAQAQADVEVAVEPAEVPFSVAAE